MEETRSSLAVARIEAALARIEKASAAPASPSPAEGALKARNAALETALREGLSELDALIERLDR